MLRSRRPRAPDRRRRAGRAFAPEQAPTLDRLLAVLTRLAPDLGRWLTLGLALLTVAMLQLWRGARSGHGGLSLAALSRTLPLDQTEKARAKRLARLLRNPRGYRKPGTACGALNMGPATVPVVVTMAALLVAFCAALRAGVRSRVELELELLALRHQLAVLQRDRPRRLRLRRTDRLVWVLLSRVWPQWRRALQIVTPDTVVRWHRQAFRLYWRRQSAPRRPGRPAVAPDIRALIRDMQAANPLWGAPRLHGELRKLGITVAQSTVAKYVGPSAPTPSSQTWRTFLANHVSQLASVDFFTLPTATFRVLFVFVVLAHARRRILHVSVTAHPTAAWTAQQLREAFPWDTAPRFLLRDRDAIYGSAVRGTVQEMGVEDVLTAPRAPWQNPFVERLIGSLRRECLDHVIVSE